MLVCAVLIVSASGCQYFDWQHHPTGFSSTHHNQVVSEKAQIVRAREEKRRLLAEHRRKKSEETKRIANLANADRHQRKTE